MPIRSTSSSVGGWLNDCLQQIQAAIKSGSAQVALDRVSKRRHALRLWAPNRRGSAAETEPVNG
jgi:hypothetical protein